MTMHKKTFTVDVDEELSEAFSAQVDERGYTKYRALEGAIRAFIVIPAEIQVKLMSNTKENIAELLQSPSSLSDDQIEKLWAEMERIAKKVGVKLKIPK